mmetsp:Transcript_4736/g.15519  ORF Transcript_4736/g.15519 Transcript_4736/m.15519 type:complete len:207 (-) Transcript_4736:1258-1878(-)|eukprot:scaffold164_cov105-Isochrysis_galbana.AAC.11
MCAPSNNSPDADDLAFGEVGAVAAREVWPDLAGRLGWREEGAAEQHVDHLVVDLGAPRFEGRTHQVVVQSRGEGSQLSHVSQRAERQKWASPSVGCRCEQAAAAAAPCMWRVGRRRVGGRGWGCGLVGGRPGGGPLDGEGCEQRGKLGGRSTGFDTCACRGLAGRDEHPAKGGEVVRQDCEQHVDELAGGKEKRRLGGGRVEQDAL